MLLAVSEPNYSMRDDKIFIWDTGDMTVEEIDRLRLYNLTRIGRIHIENMERVPWLSDNVTKGYVVQNTHLVPFKEPVMLGCGDIWYKRYVYNDFTGRLFEVNTVPLTEIVVRDTYYMFRVEFGTFIPNVATFVIKPTNDLCSSAMGDEGIRVTREEFIKKLSLGVL